MLTTGEAITQRWEYCQTQNVMYIKQISHNGQSPT